MIKAIAVAVTAGVVRLLWPTPEPPDALITEVMSHTLVHMETCDLEDLGLQGAECIVTEDDQRRYWMILFDDEIKINMVVLYDGATSVLWCKEGSCT